MMRQRAILGALLVLRVCPALADEKAGTPWPQECRLVRVASLPMTHTAGHITIPVDVNGTQEAFVLDTGGYASGLSSATIAALGLKRQPVKGAIIKDAGGKIAGEYVRTDTLGFGRMLGKDQPLLAMDGLFEADGLLAPDFMRNFDVELDFAASTVNIFHHHPCSDRVVYWTDAWKVLPFDITHDGHIRVPVTLDGEDTHAVIDTGAPVSVISMASADTLFDINVKSPGMTKVGRMSGGGGGTFDTYGYPFKTLTVGSIAVSNPSVRIADTPNYLRTDFAKMLLGLSIIEHLHVYIAYSEGKLYVSDANAH